MAKFILGKKIAMTRVYDKNGKMIPVTLVEAGPCVVTKIISKEKEGYNAIQIGFGKAKRISKPLAGQIKKLGQFKYLKEFIVADPNAYKIGQIIDVSAFSQGDIVKVSGVSKAKGYAGGMKRFGFKGGPASHGQKHSSRERGSVGPRFPEHVVKGVRMPGRMGGARISAKGLAVVEIDKENNILAIKGAIPGRRDTLIEISAK